MGVQNSTVLEVNDFEQSAANGLYHRAFDLIAQAIPVDNRAALEGFNNADDFYIACSRINGHLGACGDVASLLNSACDSEAARRRTLLPAPAEFVCSGFEHRPRPGIADVLQSKLQWIHRQQMCEFVHVRFTSKMVRGGGKTTIRTLAQRRIGRMKFDLLISDIVGSRDSGRS